MKVTETLKEKIRQCISGVVYTVDAKPRLTFTDGSPLEKKLALIDDGVENVVDLIERDNGRNLLRLALVQLQQATPNTCADVEIEDYNETIASIEDYLK